LEALGLYYLTDSYPNTPALLLRKQVAYAQGVRLFAQANQPVEQAYMLKNEADMRLLQGYPSQAEQALLRVLALYRAAGQPPAAGVPAQCRGSGSAAAGGAAVAGLQPLPPQAAQQPAAASPAARNQPAKPVAGPAAGRQEPVAGREGMDAKRNPPSRQKQPRSHQQPAQFAE
nr:hypothetical protein [Tanacetum cinerariifolium]